MNEAAPQAASGTISEDAASLDVLRLIWGDSYMFGTDDEHGWWVIRDGKIGSILTSDSAERLGTLLAEQEEQGCDPPQQLHRLRRAHRLPGRGLLRH